MDDPMPLPCLTNIRMNVHQVAGVLLGLMTSTVGLPAAAQPFSAAKMVELLPVPGILNNSVTNLHAEGDTLWVGPLLNLTTDDGQSWQVAESDSLQETANRVFSIDAEGAVVWVGLGYTDPGSGQPSAGGFLVSTDGGRSFTYRFPQLDAPGDSLLTYGISSLKALPVIVPQQSPPYDLDYDPVRDELWVAAWASGLRKSTDGGRTWQRVVLPPDNLDAIDPAVPYNFRLEPQRGTLGNLNHMGFGVLVDETGTVWAGSAGGLNRSTDGGRAWQKFLADGTVNGPLGNWIISLEEQPLPGRNPVWVANWVGQQANEQFGVTVTRDGGQTFEQMLTGRKVFDFAFRGNTVYVAGEDGLFISDDDGRTWRSIRSFRDASQPDRAVRPNAEVFSVATTPDALWVGTGDGLLRSTDEGETWRLFRVEVPLNPEQPSGPIPRTETFAYPNPFSANSDRIVRLRYELDADRAVEVRIFDFGMNLVRRLDIGPQAAGVRETTWDGTDDEGLRVANGVYFYEVRTGTASFRGKLLVIE
jgi:photosystem II stability/assembly factor-like uncharacterized protein